jgi:hypothetical protein
MYLDKVVQKGGNTLKEREREREREKEKVHKSNGDLKPQKNSAESREKNAG